MWSNLRSKCWMESWINLHLFPFWWVTNSISQRHPESIGICVSDFLRFRIGFMDQSWNEKKLKIKNGHCEALCVKMTITAQAWASSKWPSLPTHYTKPCFFSLRIFNKDIIEISRWRTRLFKFKRVLYIPCGWRKSSLQGLYNTLRQLVSKLGEGAKCLFFKEVKNRSPWSDDLKISEKTAPLVAFTKSKLGCLVFVGDYLWIWAIYNDLSRRLVTPNGGLVRESYPKWP